MRQAATNKSTRPRRDKTPATRLAGAERAYRAGVEYFLGPLLKLLEDPSVSEIMVNGPANVFVERQGRIEREATRFEDEQALRAAANNIAQFVGKTIDEREPLLEGRLPDGSRVTIVLQPIAAHGTSINIRRFSREALTGAFLIEQDAITGEALEFLMMAVRAGLNIVVSGGTGSGKTTIVNILSTGFRDDERIVVIEDTRELQVQKDHVVQMEARPPDAYGRGEITIRDLFVTALRMRPDRVVVGEVRRGEALDMVQAMTSGHRGSLTTLHADTPLQACGRLETMCMMADVGLPLSALRRQVSLALDLIVQTSRLHDGRRLITHISEVGLDASSSRYEIREIFNLVKRGMTRKLRWTGKRPLLAAEIRVQGLASELKHSKRVLAVTKRGAKS